MLVLTDPEPWLANVLSITSFPALEVLGISFPEWEEENETNQRYTLLMLGLFLETCGTHVKACGLFPAPEHLITGESASVGNEAGEPMHPEDV
ncbi:hypothetical protein PM082_009195 [Marasmius tenuissimus]|nr:hypothetical protein PM082_009195 [Marasmius tenuissimus]